MGIQRVHLALETVEHAFDENDTIAMFGRDCNGRRTIWLTEYFYDMPDRYKTEVIGHELLHAQEDPKSRLVTRWRDQGLISERQFKLYEKREEKQVCQLERVIWALLPEWPY